METKLERAARRFLDQHTGIPWLSFHSYPDDSPVDTLEDALEQAIYRGHTAERANGLYLQGLWRRIERRARESE